MSGRSGPGRAGPTRSTRPADGGRRGSTGRCDGAVPRGQVPPSLDRPMRRCSSARSASRPRRSRPADATVQFRAVGCPAGSGGRCDRQFRAVSGRRRSSGRPMRRAVPRGAVRELPDATMQFRVVSQLADATMQFRVVSEPADATDGLADVNGYLGQAELRALIRSILADMKPREREVIELSFRHDLHDDDLAIALGMSSSRAHALASRTRGRLEKSLGALRTALAGRQACPVMGELLADWDGQLTEQTRDLVAWHIEQCQTCINHARGALRPTVLSGLLPLAPLPPELREKVLSRCSSTSEEAVAYRRRVVRRAESTWAALFSQAIRRASWDSIRANPGAAVATAAVAVWVVAAVSVTLLTFAGPHAAHAQTAQPAGSRATHAPAAQTSAGTPPSSAAAVPATATPSHPPPRGRPRPSLSPGLRVVPGPAVAVARGVEIAVAKPSSHLAQAVAITSPSTLAVAVALALTLVIPVADGLRPTPERCDRTVAN